MEVKFPLKIIVKPNSNRNEIIEQEDKYIVRIKSRAENNQANKELIKFLSKTFKKRIKIIKGFKSKEKIIDYF